MAVNGLAGPAVFLDKDGTLIDDLPGNADPMRIRLAPGAGLALQQLRMAGYRLLLVSNQPGIALGWLTPLALRVGYQRLQQLLAASGAWLDGFYWCPHRAGMHACACRKPQPGLLLRAALEQRINLAQSWMVGDILDDVEAGRRAGCRAVHLDNGNETQWLAGPLRRPQATVASLPQAARVILASPAWPRL